MTEDEQKRIFRAFERLDNARYLPGFGLGLAIVSRLTELLGGRITVESPYGTGSLFRVALPLSEVAKHGEDGENGYAEDYGLEGTYVLVIDDDRIQLDITRRMLVRNKVRCECCRTVRELMAALRERTYDLLLSDIQMPDMDGYEATRAIRLSEKVDAADIPIIALTANAFAEDAKAAHDTGMNAHLSKPLDFNKLKNILARIKKNGAVSL